MNQWDEMKMVYIIEEPQEEKINVEERNSCAGEKILGSVREQRHIKMKKVTRGDTAWLVP